MKVVVSAGGRFHAHRLAHQLAKQNSLLKLFTFDYTTKDNLFPSSYAHVVSSCKLLNDLFVKLRLAKYINASRFNVFKDNLFDSIVKRKTSNLEPFDIFVGWAHYAAKTIPIARKKGALVIIESGSCHIQSQENILSQVYAKFNVPFQPINQACKQKMLAEYEQADYIMTLSSFAKQSFLDQGISPQKILMAPCGIDTDFFYAPKQQTPNLFQVIFVGLVGLRKGIHTLLEAWKIAQLPEHKSRLIIIGATQKDFALVAGKLPQSSSVVFAGPQNRNALKKLYSQSSLFVLPSLEDGFGMVIGEAMASGLPVICSTHTAGKELTDNENYGFLVEPEQPKQLAEKIVWCFNNQDHIHAMGTQGQIFIKNFSWDAYGKRIFTIYKQLLTQKN